MEKKEEVKIPTQVLTIGGLSVQFTIPKVIVPGRGEVEAGTLIKEFTSEEDEEAQLETTLGKMLVAALKAPRRTRKVEGKNITKVGAVFKLAKAPKKSTQKPANEE